MSIPADAYGPRVPAIQSEPDLEPDEPDGDAEPRCWRCNRKLAEWVSRPWRIRCSRCKADNTGVVLIGH